jgi:hypothetical protein
LIERGTTLVAPLVLTKKKVRSFVFPRDIQNVEPRFAVRVVHGICDAVLFAEFQPKMVAIFRVRYGRDVPLGAKIHVGFVSSITH